MSGIGSATTSSSGSASSGSDVQYGTNVPPISFPGIASGIDYNSIINKYTQMTLEQETPLQNQITSLNSQQSELLKIQDLIGKFQDTFQAISDPANFTATKPTSSNSAAIAASTIAGTVATPGNYVIDSATLATATQISNDPGANGSFSETAALADAGASITPTNGSGTQGQITINGLQLSYDVNATTLQSFIASNASALASVGVTMSYDASTQAVTITSTQPLTLGSATDQGNLLQTLKLDTAQITDNGGTYTATSTSAIGGINVGAVFNTGQNAGFATAVTSGSFSINGVAFNVDSTTNNLNDILNEINQSSAGVIASYDQATDSVVLTAKADGPQGITLGSSGDTSNFLQAAGFLTNYQQANQLSAGATENVGNSAKIIYTDAAGTQHTVYSNSNDVTNVVPGVSLDLQQAVDGTAVAPVTISVAQDSGALQTAIGNWVTAYNALINEINTATQAPVVGTSTDSTTGTTSGAQLSGGGVLFNNDEVDAIKDQLVNLVSGYMDTGSSSYNSLASIGLTLDSSFSVSSASDTSDSSDSSDTSNSANGVTTQQEDGTSGQLQGLDVSALTSALSADPGAVAQLFTGANSVITQVGSYLTSVAGLPTQLTSGMAGTIPTQSLLSTVQSQNQDQISSLQQQISLITDQANMQADQLRAEFTNSETQIAELQSMQQSLGALGLTGSTS